MVVNFGCVECVPAMVIGYDLSNYFLGGEYEGGWERGKKEGRRLTIFLFLEERARGGVVWAGFGMPLRRKRGKEALDFIFRNQRPNQ